MDGVKSWDLTTLEAARAYLQANANGATADNDVLQRMISSMSSAVANYCNRNQLLTGTVTETRNGNSKATMMTREYPVTAMTSVTINGAVMPASSYVFDSDEIHLLNSVFSNGIKNVILVYTAGHVAGDMKASVFEHAVLEWVAVRFRERGHIGEESKAAQGMTTSYTQKDLPDTAKELLSSNIRYTGF